MHINICCTFLFTLGFFIFITMFIVQDYSIYEFTYICDSIDLVLYKHERCITCLLEPVELVDIFLCNGTTPYKQHSDEVSMTFVLSATFMGISILYGTYLGITRLFFYCVHINE
jgi:hypothetical protein